LKKSDFSRRPPGKSGNGRNQNRQGKPPGNRNSRPNSRAKNSEAVKQWLSAPSTALTSHIKMINKKQQDGDGKNSTTRNGSAKYSTKGKGRFKSNQDKPKQNTRPKRPAHRHEAGSGKDREANQAAKNPKPQSQANTNSQPKKVANLDPFELFCAYHLGIDPTKNYKPSNINEVANRFRQDPAMIRQALKEYDMDAGSLLDRDFDMAMAQLDIQVAPEGVDRVELAKSIYEDFLEAPHVKRDWKKILDEDRKENSKVFGRN
jgi:hypothetical protein